MAEPIDDKQNKSSALEVFQLRQQEAMVACDQLTQLKEDYLILQSTIDAIRDHFKRGLHYLEERLYYERELRDYAELSVALLEDKGRFIDDNARAIIKGLQRRIIALESLAAVESNGTLSKSTIAETSPVSLDANQEVNNNIPSRSSSTASNQTRESQPELVSNETIRLSKLLLVREQQLERITAQLNDVNHDYMRQHKELAETTDALERARARCIALQVELSREKRLTKDLETKLWQFDRCAAFKHALTASAVPVVVSFPDRFPTQTTSATKGLSTYHYPLPPPSVSNLSLSSTSNNQKQKFLIPSHEFLAEFRSEVLSMAKSLAQLDNKLNVPPIHLSQHPPPTFL